MDDITLAAMGRIMKRAEIARVSDDAKRELKRRLEEIGFNISKRAWKFAQHSGRNTVKARDIQLAFVEKGT